MVITVGLIEMAIFVFGCVKAACGNIGTIATFFAAGVFAMVAAGLLVNSFDRCPVCHSSCAITANLPGSCRCKQCGETWGQDD